MAVSDRRSQMGKVGSRVALVLSSWAISTSFLRSRVNRLYYEGRLNGDPEMKGRRATSICPSSMPWSCCGSSADAEKSMRRSEAPWMAYARIPHQRSSGGCYAPGWKPFYRRRTSPALRMLSTYILRMNQLVRDFNFGHMALLEQPCLRIRADHSGPASARGLTMDSTLLHKAR